MINPKTCRFIEKTFLFLFTFLLIEMWVFLIIFALRSLASLSYKVIASFLLLILLSNMLAKVAQMHISAIHRVWK
ncbi:MAG: hypothetical protein HYT94_04725 [Parcubacteria group bacterium]|nr:hypothetical protein [Parcubacteria group bacterium]